jgi:hypothetical protein
MRSWHLLPGDFTITNQQQWDERVMTPLLAQITTKLGVEQWAPIHADLYRLLVYEEGCFFRRHRDNERLDGCFGTLVIQLPSAFQGGELSVYQPSDLIDASSAVSSAMRFSQQGDAAKNGMHAFFFFADCYHEIEEVTSGARLALVYTLYHRSVNDTAASLVAAKKPQGLLNKQIVIQTGEPRTVFVMCEGWSDGAKYHGRRGVVLPNNDASDYFGEFGVQLEGPETDQPFLFIGEEALRVMVHGSPEAAEAVRIAIPSPVPPQPVDMVVSEQIARAVREWELETGLSYHYNADNPESNKGAINKHGWEIRAHTTPSEATLEKPHKFVAILSHEYTPTALKEGLHALKRCDRVLGNMLNAARRISTADKGLGTLAAEALLRNADAEAMQNLTESEYEVLVSRLSRKLESGESTANGPSPSGSSFTVRADQVEEPYVFDVFLTMITGVSREDSSDFVESLGSFTTGSFIPLLPGDPAVFEKLEDIKETASACWEPTCHDGMEIGSPLLKWLLNHRDSDERIQSLHAFHLLRDDGLICDGYDDPNDENWNAWKAHHDMQPEALCQPYRRQDLRRGDLHIGVNELLLTNDKLFESQTEQAIDCTIKHSWERKWCCNVVGNLGSNFGFDDDPKALEFAGNGGWFPGRWYSRAAIIFWPRAHRPALLEKAFDQEKHCSRGVNFFSEISHVNDYFSRI